MVVRVLQTMRLVPLIIAAALPTFLAHGAFCADRGQVLEQQKRQAIEAMRKKPLLDKTRIEEIFSVRREGTDLVVHTFVTPTKGYIEQRAELHGIPFPATVQCRELSRDIPQVHFEFDIESWPKPLLHGLLHFQSQPGSLQMENHCDSPEGESIVTFSQDGMRVELKVFASDAASRSSSVRMQADTFLELRRQHPLEVETYLRPIFREIRQEAALAPEPHEAWQVLADDWPVDGSFKGKVEKYLNDLDSNDFRVRSAAAGQLFRLGRGAAVYLIHMDRKSLSPEQILRIDEVIARYKPLPEARAAKLHDDLHFLVDCLDCDDAVVRKLALARLQKLTGKELEFDVDAKIDARVALTNDLRDELFRADGSLKTRN